MKKEWIKSKYGYDIPCCNQLNGKEKTLIICHGFGSSKDSPIIQALQKTMPLCGIGTYSFDFPAHGESPVDGTFLRIPYCLENLEAVEEHVLQLAPHNEIYYLGSSFGAYILLLYLATNPHKGSRSFLRSAAVNMPQIFNKWLYDSPPTWHASLDGDPMGDFVNLDGVYSRDLLITRAFLKDLEQFDIFQLYPKDVGSLSMIHGGLDSTALASDAARFAKLAGATFHLLPEAEHRLMGEGEMETVLATIIQYFSHDSVS